MPIYVRKASETDIDDIYRLIAELAEYERAGHELILTSADLLQHFKSGYFKAWVARYENQTVGMALCYDRYSTWKGRSLYLEDIIVQEKYRRIGAGSALMRTLISYARREGYFSINWQVLTWNEPALHFYKKWNAEIDRQWWNGRIIINNSDNNESI
ncbi:MAG: GNAT family N-acetyltransferase [Thermaurantimonas sp.]